MQDRRHNLLIIGGYGTFGGRLARLLSNEPRLRLFVAGRSLHKASALARQLGGPAAVIPARFDREDDVRSQIRELSPDIVVDASGPWQAYGTDPYRIARAAILAGAHYLDLADGTDFVCNIVELDQAARRRNVFALSGASTCPVLTTAVARHLSRGLQDIASISGGIAPSPFAGMGKSVVRAIAGYAGMPVRVRLNDQQIEAHTFVSTRTFTIAPPGIKPLPAMTFSLIDVPDLQLLQSLDVPVRGTWFGVSTLPAVYHALLRLLARAVKARMVPTLEPLAGIMHFVMNNLSWGEHRGGMFVEVEGTDDEGRLLTRSWHLVAQGDDGPTIPAMAANAIVRSWLDGRAPEPGARPANGALTIADYLPMFAQLEITTGERRSPVPRKWPLFRRVLGDAWQELPAQIRDLHGEIGANLFEGKATIVQGRSLLARIAAKMFGFPGAAHDVPVTVHMDRSEIRENWYRDFAGHRFSSELSAGQGRMSHLLCERFGPCRIAIALVADGDTLRYLPRRWTLFGVPMPKALLPAGAMYETVVDGRFRFHVEVRLPVAGHVVTYSGWLDAVTQASSASRTAR